MGKCIVCEENYSDKRLQLGYKTCLTCGGKQAAQETKRKSKCIAPAYNKGDCQYITSKQCVKNIYQGKS